MITTIVIALYFGIFIRPEKFENYFSTPREVSGEILFAGKEGIYIYKRYIRKIHYDDYPISPIGDDGLFCSLHSFIISQNFKKKIFFPCIIPPIKFKNSIFFLDIKGNLCKINGDTSCVNLGEEDELIYLPTPQIVKYGERIFVPYKNTIFSVDENLNYIPIIERKYDIVSFSIGNDFIVADEKFISVYNLSYQLLWEKKFENIVGFSSGENQIFLTFSRGIAILDTSGKLKIVKEFSPLSRISNPEFYEGGVVFVVEFGKLSRFLGGKSFLILMDKNGKVKKSYSLHSFSNRVVLQGNKLFLYSEDGTLYIFYL